MPALQAVIFDLDGTLIDTAAAITEALNRVLAEFDLHPLAPAEVVNMVGDGALRLLERGFAAAGRPLDDATSARLLPRYVDVLAGLPPAPSDVYPGVLETLSRLDDDGMTLGVCSNKPESAVHTALAATHLTGFFGAIIGGDTLATRKPDAEPLLAAIRRLGASPGRSVMVGDNANDVAAARAAEIPVVVVSYGYPRGPIAALGADAVIDRFAELPDVLRSME